MISNDKVQQLCRRNLSENKELQGNKKVKKHLKRLFFP